MKRSRAFTLIELLVVVAIIALLIAILLPSLNRARESAKRTVCATNLKGQGAGVAIYASQFGDYLPVGGLGTGNWFHDQSVFYIDQVWNASQTLNMGEDSFRRLWYCPSNARQNTDTAWRNPGGGGTGNIFRDIGYTYLNAGRQMSQVTKDPISTTDPLVTPTRINPPLVFHNKWSGTLFPSTSELATDEISSSTIAAPFDFDVPLAASTAGLQAASSHLVGSTPAGGNSLHFDGHVSWHKFSVDTSNYLTINVTPKTYFWVPSPND